MLLAEPHHHYTPVYRALATDSAELEAWLLACVLRAEPDRAVAYADLVRLPALFPFRITVTSGQLRWLGFAVERQGGGLELVRYEP